MADLSDQAYQSLILQETGVTTDPVATTNITNWWAMHTSRGKSGYLAYLYTKQSVLMYLLGIVKRRRDLVIGPNQIRASQLFANALGEINFLTKFIKEQDPNYTQPSYITSITPTQRNQPSAAEIDSVQDAVDWVRQYHPNLDEYVMSAPGVGLWLW